MKSNSPQPTGSNDCVSSTKTPRAHSGATYQKARDDRKRPIRGLWVRNGRYYAQLKVRDANSGVEAVRRIPLEGVNTTAEAVKAMNRLKVQREDNELPVLRRTPTFEEYAKQY